MALRQWREPRGVEPRVLCGLAAYPRLTPVLQPPGNTGPVALVAGRLGAAAGSTQVTEIGKKIAAVLVRMDAFLIVNDLLAFIGGWGSGGGSHS